MLRSAGPCGRYAVDVLRCERCGGRRRLLAAITEKATAKKILARLGLPTDPIVARPRARDPADIWARAPSVVEWGRRTLLQSVLASADRRPRTHVRPRGSAASSASGSGDVCAGEGGAPTAGGTADAGFGDAGSGGEGCARGAGP